jgi:hypothetical protein
MMKNWLTPRLPTQNNFCWCGIIIGNNHTTPQQQHHTGCNYDLGSSKQPCWFSVCRLILTQLDNIWKMTSIFLKMEDDLEDSLHYQRHFNRSCFLAIRQTIPSQKISGTSHHVLCLSFMNRRQPQLFPVFLNIDHIHYCCRRVEQVYFWVED